MEPLVLVISGSMGAGKTTLMAEASDLLGAAGVVHAAIDLDALSIGHLPPESVSVSKLNLALLWKSYAALGVTRLVIAGAIESASRLAEVRGAVPHAHILICRVRARIATMQERVRQREPGMLQREFVERVVLLDEELDSAALHDFEVDNEARGVTAAAREILEIAGWLPRAAPEPKCPHCGNGAGIYLAPREERSPEAPIRCLACRADAPATQWMA